MSNSNILDLIVTYLSREKKIKEMFGENIKN